MLECRLSAGFVRLDGQETRTSKAVKQVVRPAAGEDPSASQHSQPPPPATDELRLPPSVPVWTSQQQLFDMVERPFTLSSEDGTTTGPFTAMYRWPAKRQQFGEYWCQKKSVNALTHIYMDYFFLKVKQSDTRDRLQARYPHLFVPPGANPLNTVPFPNVKSLWRNEKVPNARQSWRDLVVDHLKTTLGIRFREPF